ncbi:MAG: phosphate/phosphite/phosphonate ABC transporter substrate-binding protein [Gammaproteobacteria bacterium]|nr:phosphate/phosphite/phosphonate ABC transporter substrate-binding protein [Gammaproteobacteria bacterium]
MLNHVLSLTSLSIILLAYPVTVLSDYIFTAPPRESMERGIEIYKPIADYLTRTTGEKFTYRHPQNWSDYSKGMQNHEFDMAFDGPHFVSWRIKNINHDTIAKLPQLHIWRVIARRDNDQVNSVDDLVGRKVCAPKSPNFGMLTMMSHFSNPDKQPVHIVTKGWKDGFNGVVLEKCEAAVLPKTNHRKFDPQLSETKAIHTHLPYPNQAFTLGPRITPDIKMKIQKNLLSEDGQVALSKLRDRFTRGAKLVSAENEEYEGISMVLKRAGNFLAENE